MRHLPAVALAALLTACAATPGAGMDGSLEAPACAHAPTVIEHPYIVFFDSGASAVTPRGHQVVAEFAAMMARVPGFTADLKGHTDAVEARTARPSLSLARARAIRAAVVARGVAAERVTAMGYGAMRPLLPGEAAEPQNRRVEFVVRGEASPQRLADMRECRTWVRDHCFVPARLAQASAPTCDAVMNSF